jgi:alpha-L-fucosidase 2
MSWKNGKATRLTLRSAAGGSTTVAADGRSHDVSLRAGQSVTLTNL